MLRIVLLILWACTAQANLNIELTQGITSAQTIHVSPFDGQALAATDQQFARIIMNDLYLSGRFKAAPIRAAEALVTGEVRSIGNHKFSITVNLFDQLDNGKKLFSKQFESSDEDFRALAHQISNLIYEEILGEPGIFHSKLAYILTQPKSYQLMVADIDGFNAKAVLKANYPLMSPSWSPDGRSLVFVSFANKRASINILDIYTGQQHKLLTEPGINGAPAWSPDGNKLAVVLSKSGAPCIYILNLKTHRLRRLTYGPAIDTEPTWSPDGKLIYFTSDRGGSPQIYRINTQGKKFTRMTFEGSYNATPSVTKNQALILLHRDPSGFNIAIQDLKSNTLQNLTFSGDTESPALSPNHQMVIFSSQSNKKRILNMVSINAQIRLKIPSPEGDIQEPAWGG